MRLRLVSYNIHKGFGADRAYDLERIASVLRAYEPDVVALQEVMRFHPEYERPCQLEVLGEALDMPHRAVGWNVQRPMGVYGNATLSRLPFDGHENLSLKWRFKKERSALYTQLPARDGPLHVFNVHLGLAHFERVRQMRRLAGLADERCGDGGTVILGDVNDWRDGLYRKVLRNRGFERPARRRFDRAHRTFPSWFPVGNLDQTYARGDVRVVEAFPARTAAARRASDHLPVVLDLEV